MKNQPISKKKKSIFVKFSFARDEVSSVEFKTLHGITRTEAAEHLSILYDLWMNNVLTPSTAC